MKKIDYRAELKEEYARWKRLFCQGGQDPFWPDGVNLNLIRNHITACRAALEQEDKTVPEEYGWLLPPEVPPDYMARGKEIWYRGMESYKKYTADENYQYLKEVSDTLPEKVKKESSIENVLGEKNQDRVKKTASAALVLAFLAWVLVVMLELTVMKPYFRWQSGGAETIMGYGIPYLRICMLGSLGMMGQWVFDRFVMASGKSSLFLFTLSAASITNLVLDPILIFGYFGLPAMGTAGAALATVIGQWIGCFAGYFINRRWNREIPIRFTIKADTGCMAAILKVGIPSTFVQVITSVLAIYVNSVLMAITPTAVAVYGACVKIQGLVTVGVNGMGSGLIPIVAYNYGAKKPERIYQSCRWAMLYSVMLYSVFFLIMEIVPEQVLLLFDASKEMLAIGVTALRIMAVSYLLSNVCLTFSSAFQGLGMGVQSMLLTLSRQVVMPVLLITAVSWFGELSLIWWAFVLAEALVIPVGMILWKKESGKSLGALTVMCSE